jgi:hypothetical protein
MPDAGGLAVVQYRSVMSGSTAEATCIPISFEKPFVNRTRLPICILRVIAADAILFRIHVQHILRPIRIDWSKGFRDSRRMIRKGFYHLIG